MRHALVRLKRSFLARTFNDIVQAADALFNPRVLGVDGPYAVHRERVTVEVWRQRTSGDRPNAFLVLLQLYRPGRFHPVAAQCDFGRLRSVDPKRHSIARPDLGRDEGIVQRWLAARRLTHGSRHE